MSLADELHATNALLRSAVAPPAPEPTPPPRPGDRPAVGLQGSTCLLAVAQFAGMNILGDHFREVPAQHVTREDFSRDVAIACSCGQRVELSFGQLSRCRCGRWYYSGASVRWAPAPEPHACSANAEGWCDQCGEDIEPSSTTDPKEGP